jgi:hypothetical protein
LSAERFHFGIVACTYYHCFTRTCVDYFCQILNHSLTSLITLLCGRNVIKSRPKPQGGRQYTAAASRRLLIGFVRGSREFGFLSSFSSDCFHGQSRPCQAVKNKLWPIQTRPASTKLTLANPDEARQCQASRFLLDNS